MQKIREQHQQLQHQWWNWDPNAISRIFVWFGDSKISYCGQPVACRQWCKSHSFTKFILRKLTPVLGINPWSNCTYLPTYILALPCNILTSHSLAILVSCFWMSQILAWNSLDQALNSEMWLGKSFLSYSSKLSTVSFKVVKNITHIHLSSNFYAICAIIIWKIYLLLLLTMTTIE